MVSFDVKSSFTSISLAKIMILILKRIYDRKEIKTQIPKTLMKNLQIVLHKGSTFYIHKWYFPTNWLYGNGSIVRFSSCWCGIGPNNIFAVELDTAVFVVELETAVAPTSDNALFE